MSHQAIGIVHSGRAVRLALGISAISVLAAGCTGPQWREPTLDQRRELERRAVWFLLRSTGDETPLYRMHAIEALQDVAPEEGLNHIRDAVRDPVVAVRFAALLALGAIRDRESLELIRTCAEDNDPHVRIAALFALHRMGDTGRTSELASFLLGDPKPSVRANAALAIGLLGEPKSVKLLKRARGDREESVRLQALEAMTLLGDEKAARDLLFYGHSGVGPKMVQALMALGTARSEMAADLFAYRLNEGPYDEVRLAAARGLGRIGRPTGFELAMGMLSFRSTSNPDDVDPPEQQEARVRTLAAAALEAIGDARALDRLGRAMDDPDQPTPVRIAAARAILGIIRVANHPLNVAALPSRGP